MCPVAMYSLVSQNAVVGASRDRIQETDTEGDDECPDVDRLTVVGSVGGLVLSVWHERGGRLLLTPVHRCSA